MDEAWGRLERVRVRDSSVFEQQAALVEATRVDAQFWLTDIPREPNYKHAHYRRRAGYAPACRLRAAGAQGWRMPMMSDPPLRELSPPCSCPTAPAVAMHLIRRCHVFPALHAQGVCNAAAGSATDRGALGGGRGGRARPPGCRRPLSRVAAAVPAPRQVFLPVLHTPGKQVQFSHGNPRFPWETQFFQGCKKRICGWGRDLGW